MQPEVVVFDEPRPRPRPWLAFRFSILATDSSKAFLYGEVVRHAAVDFLRPLVPIVFM